MVNRNPSASFNARIRAALNESPPHPDFVHRLEAELISRAGQPTRFRVAPAIPPPTRKRFWYTAATLLILLVLAAAVIGPQKVLAAIQGIVGYVRGIGFVQDAETALVLSGPVKVARGGITITVKEAVADTAATRVRLHINVSDNRLRKMILDQQEGLMTGRIRLLLDGETAIEPQGFEILVDPFLEVTAVFGPLPLGRDTARLRLERIPGLVASAGPEDWEIPMQFIPAKTDPRLRPAKVIQQASDTLHGLTLIIQHAAPLPGRTALQVIVQASDAAVGVSPNWVNHLHLEDLEGRPIPFEYSPDRQPNDLQTAILDVSALESGKTYRMVLSGPVEVAQRLEHLPINTFTLDFSSAPLSEQRWALNIPLEVDSLSTKIDRARLMESEGSLWLKFDLEPPDGAIQSVMIFPTDQTTSVGRVGLNRVELNEVPTMPLRLWVGTILYRLDGEWIVEWTVP